MSEKQTETATEKLSPEILQRELLSTEMFRDLESTVAEILRDTKVSEEEVVPLRVTWLRMRVGVCDVKLRVLRQLRASRNDPRGTEELKKQIVDWRDKRFTEFLEGNKPVESNVERFIQDLDDERQDYLEKIGHELTMLKNVQIYLRLHRQYHEMKKWMADHNFSTVVVDRGVQEERERAMDEQRDRLLELLRHRAIIANVAELGARANLEPGHGVAAQDIQQAKQRLDIVMDEYFQKVLKEERPRLPAATLLRDQRLLDRLRGSAVDVVDQLHAEIHYTDRSLVRAEMLYRRLAWALQGRGERMPNDVAVEIDAFVKEMETKNYESSVDVRSVVQDLKSLLPHPEKFTEADVIKLYNRMPKRKPASAILASELLVAWGDQLAKSPQANEEARKLYMHWSFSTIGDLFHWQVFLMKELSGREYLQYLYTGELPKDRADLAPETPSPALLETHRAEARQRVQETLAGLQTFEMTMQPTLQDRSRDAASHYIVEPARAIYRQVERVMGTRQLRTEEQAGYVEIKRSFPHAVLEDFARHCQIFDQFLQDRRMGPESLRSTVTRLTPADAPRLRQKMHELQDFSPGITGEVVDKLDDEGRLLRLMWLYDQVDGDLQKFKDATAKLEREYSQKGTGEKNRLEELQKFKLDVQAMMEAMLRQILKWILIVAGTLAGGYLGIKTLGWWWRGRHMGALRREVRSLGGEVREMKDLLRGQGEEIARLKESGGKGPAERVSPQSRAAPSEQAPPRPPAESPAPEVPPAGSSVPEGTSPPKSVPEGGARPPASVTENPAGKVTSGPEAKVAESAAEKGGSRFLGHAGFLLMEASIVSDILQSLERTASAELMNERETLDAVKELWRDAARGAKLEGSGDQFWMAGYNKKYYEALKVATATGEREWMAQEHEVISQSMETLDMQLLLQSAAVPTDLPRLPELKDRAPAASWTELERERTYLQEEGGDLERRRQALLKNARELHTVRASEFPVYQVGTPLGEQPLTRDRKTGKINVNLSSRFLFMKVKAGPLERFRQAGQDQRVADEFVLQKAQEDMQKQKDAFRSFQKDLQKYLERAERFERAVKSGPLASPERPQVY